MNRNKKRKFNSYQGDNSNGQQMYVAPNDAIKFRKPLEFPKREQEYVGQNAQLKPDTRTPYEREWQSKATQNILNDEYGKKLVESQYMWNLPGRPNHVIFTPDEARIALGANKIPGTAIRMGLFANRIVPPLLTPYMPNYLVPRPIGLSPSLDLTRQLFGTGAKYN